MLEFICYTKCSTCQKAAKWLKERDIEVSVRDIVSRNPSYEELSKWIKNSEKPLSKFFNTSGLKYKAMNLKLVVKTASDEELIEILSSDGMLVKRPLLIADGFTLVGFNEEEWGSYFEKK